jgi:hypothetical protein
MWAEGAFLPPRSRSPSGAWNTPKVVKGGKLSVINSPCDYLELYIQELHVRLDLEHSDIAVLLTGACEE